MNSTYSNEEIDIVWRRYPSLSTIADIFRLAINTSDIDTIRLISFYQKYLPITWNLYIDSPTNILSLFSNRIDPLLLAYRLLDIASIHLYPPNYKLAIKYNIVEILLQSSIDIQVQGLSPDDIIPRITTATTEEYLELSLIHDRLDLVKAIISKYGNINLDLLVKKYKDILSIQIVKYLLPNYPQLLDILIYDEPSLIDKPYLSESQVYHMFKYDFIKIYDKYGSQRISPFAYGNIRRRIIENNKDIKQLLVLIPNLTFQDLSLALEYHSSNKDLRLFYLKVALNKGYMDILDKYILKQDALILYTYQPSDELLDLLDYKYVDMGYQIENGYLTDQLIMAAILDRNTLYLELVLPQVHLPLNRKQKLQLLLNQNQIEIKV